jgi:hypothetical protein
MLFRMIVFAAMLAMAAPPQTTAEQIVYKTPSCGCCNKWVDHMSENGFALATKDVARSSLTALKRKFGVGPKQSSCHTAMIEGYVIEGHVPARDVERLVREKPADAIGLSVPGMPVGSPGMEIGDRKDSYDVLLLKKDGTTEVFASY